MKLYVSYFMEHNGEDKPHGFLGSPGTVGFLRLTPLLGVSMPVFYVEIKLSKTLQLRLKVFEIGGKKV